MSAKNHLLKLSAVACAALAFAAWAPSSRAAEVEVTAVATSTGNEILLQLFADSPDTALYSFGVAVDYDPAQVEPLNAETDQSVWYFGDGENNHPYTGGRILSEQDRVLLIGGRLDTANPEAGLSGNDLLLGTVLFARHQAGTPDLSLGLARTAPDEDYSNFVTIERRILEQVEGALAFGPVTFDDGITDSDQDGLADSWEREHFGDLSPTPTGDADNDNSSNEEEFIAGTDPMDAGSVFELNLELDPEAVLRWPSASDRTYTVEATESLEEGFQVLEEDLSATPPENTYPANPALERAFYRVGVQNSQNP